MNLTSNEFIEMLQSDDPATNVRAAHVNMEEEEWLRVITKYPDAKVSVISNKNVPISVLTLLAKDESPRVRFEVAMKRKAGDDLLKMLAHDGNEGVRQRVVCNAKTPLSALRTLEKDEVGEIAEVAKKRIQSENHKD